jgi:RTX calcium-binding nonapeptide repeat (4 copies)/WD40-like Beta Propeller Repeat
MRSYLRHTGTAFGFATAVGVALACAAIATPAKAAWPGTNQKLLTSACPDKYCDYTNIITVDPATGATVPLTATTTSGEIYDDAVSSADGRRFAYEHRLPSGTCAIGVMNADGTGQTDISHPPTGVCDDYPAFSPDGTKILFQRREAGQVRILIMDADGANQRPLTAGPDDDRPTFSPDGTKIAFDRTVGGVSRIWTMAADGTGQAPLSTGAKDYEPDFSPDGAKVAFHRIVANNDRRVWVVDANGANEHQLRDPGSGISEAEAVFSPDGTKITFEQFSSTFDGPFPLVQVNAADGTGRAQLTPDNSFDYRPSWQPGPPAVSSPPTVSGEAQNGQMLTAGAGATVGGGSTSFQWERCDGSGGHCSDISGAQATSYELAPADIGHSLRVRQTQTGAPGSSSAESAPTGVVAPDPAACSNVFAGTAAKDVFRGTGGGDLFSGRASGDVISGGRGVDCLSGGPGKDKLSGGGAGDRLSGGAGPDKLTGGKGKDKLSGGPGNDTADVADGKRDRVNCGKGEDTVRADTKDKLRGCERVARRGVTR